MPFFRIVFFADATVVVVEHISAPMAYVSCPGSTVSCTILHF